MTYEPRSLRTRWLHDQILMVLRNRSDLRIGEIGQAIGYIPVRPDLEGLRGPDGELRLGWCGACGGRRHPYPTKRLLLSIDLQGVLVSMEKHGEVERWRADTSALYRYRLGPEAPALCDVSSFEAVLAQ